MNVQIVYGIGDKNSPCIVQGDEMSIALQLF